MRRIFIEPDDPGEFILDAKMGKIIGEHPFLKRWTLVGGFLTLT